MLVERFFRRRTPKEEKRSNAPMILIWEVEEATRYPARLKDVEKSDAFGDRETVVQVVVDDEMGCGPFRDAFWRRRVPTRPSITIPPKCTIELRKQLVSFAAHHRGW